MLPDGTIMSVPEGQERSFLNENLPLEDVVLINELWPEKEESEEKDAEEKEE